MSVLQYLLLVISALVLTLAIYLYSPPPRDVEEPHLVQAHVALYRLSDLVFQHVDMFSSDMVWRENVIACDKIDIRNGRGLKLAWFAISSRVSMISVLRHHMEMIYSPVINPSDGLLVETIHMAGIRVKVYRPEQQDQGSGFMLQPCIVYFHGGGWTLFSTDSYDTVTREMSKRTGITVVSVEYRLAPEHPYPVPFDDCLKVTRHILHHGEQYQIDSLRVGVAGDGSGGNLAAAVALRLGDEDPEFTPALRMQILIQPVLQALTFNTPSYRENAYYSLVDRAQMIRYWCHYMGVEPTSRVLTSMQQGRHVNPNVRRMLHLLYMAEAEVADMLSRKEHSKDNSVSSSTTISAKNPDLQEHDHDSDVAHAGVGIETRIQDAFFAPIMSDNVGQAPPAFVLIGDQDIARDDGLLYTNKLKQAGVNVTLRRLAGWGQGHVAPLAPSSLMATWLTFSGSTLAWDIVHSFVQENL